MNYKRLYRKIHIYTSLVIIIPLLLFTISGIFLLLKKDIEWIQPSTHKGESKTPTISFEDILATAKGVESAEISSWKDIERLDVRPSKGVVKVRNRDGYEVQVDLKSGKLLHDAKRYSDTIESIHDGSFFSDGVKYFIMLPSSIILLISSITGVYLLIPYVKRIKKS